MSIYDEPLYTKEFDEARYSFTVNVGDKKIASVEVIFGQDSVIAQAKYEGVSIKKTYQKTPLTPDYCLAEAFCQEVAEKVAIKLGTREAMEKPL